MRNPRYVLNEQVDLHHVRGDVHHDVHQGNGDITVVFPGKFSQVYIKTHNIWSSWVI